MYTIDLMFNSAANAEYPSEAALASFLGLFYGIVDGLTFFGGIFLFTSFLKKMGLIATLTILPAVSIVLIVPLFFILKIPSYFYFVFWFILILKLIEEGLRPALFDKCVLLLWQPFHPRVRSFLMSKNASIITGLAAATISITLIITTSLIGISISIFACFTIAFYVITLMMLLPLKKDYIKALSQAIANRYFEVSSNLTLSFENLALLKKYLESSYPDEVIYALKTIEKIDQQQFKNSLRKILTSNEHQLLNFALDKVKQYSFQEYFPEIITIYLENPNHFIQAKALEIAAAINYSQTQKYLQLESDDPALLSSSLIIYFKNSHSSTCVTKILNKIEWMSKASNLHMRAQAAHLIGILLEDSTYPLLHLLIKDPSDLVRKYAAEAVLKTHYRSLYENVIDNILLLTTTDEIHHEIANESLFLIQIILKNFANYSEAVAAKIIYFFANVQDTKIQDFICDLCFSESATVRQLALDAIVNVNINYDKLFLKKIYDEIGKEVNLLEKHYSDIIAIPLLEITELLRSILERKLALSLQHLFSCLSISYDKSIIEKIKNGLSKSNENEQSYAIELLDSTLTSPHKKALLPILKKIYLQERPVADNLHTPTFYQVLKSNLVLRNEDSLTLLGCAASLYIVIRASIKTFTAEINAIKKNNNPLLIETLAWLQGQA